MKGIVYGKTFEKAKIQLQEIIEDYKKIGIEPETPYNNRLGLNNFSVEFPNGDYWIAVRASENSRGRACNIAYIDRDIEQELIECVIKPTIKSYPYQAHRFY